MHAVNLPNPNRIQFIAANYSRLQGLRSLPIGLLVFFVTLWANNLHGPAPRPVVAPLLIAIAMLGLYALIDIYYRRAFGRVVFSRGHMDWIMAIAGGVVGLVAFAMDVSFKLSISAAGLVLAASILVDYLMLVHISKVWYMSAAPAFALLIALVSVLPLLGFDNWWKALGIHTAVLGVMMVSGMILAVASLVSHFIFTHFLSLEARHGRSV